MRMQTDTSARIARNTQLILAEETGVPKVVDPLGGSYYVENLTDRVEEEALAIMAEMDEGGGAVACIESGWTQRRIAESAYRMQKRIESGERVVVGVNRFVGSNSDVVEITKISPRHQAGQARALKLLRAGRPQGTLERHSAAIERAARSTENQ